VTALSCNVIIDTKEALELSTLFELNTIGVMVDVKGALELSTVLLTSSIISFLFSDEVGDVDGDGDFDGDGVETTILLALPTAVTLILSKFSCS